MWMLLLLALADWTAVERLIARGSFATAQTELARLPKDSARWHVLASKIADGLNDPAAAVTAAEAALKLEPRNEAAHVQLGGIFLSRNTPDAALDIFTEAQTVLPHSSLVRLGRGLAFKELQRWDEAEAELALCLPNLLAFDALATILIQRGRFADAAKLAQRFLENAPNDHRAWYFIAAAKDGLDQPGVEDTVRRSIKLRPEFAAAHALHGKWLLKNNRLAEAAIELENAARLRPDLVQAHLHLAQTYQRLNREDDAAREFNIVRDLKDKEKTPRQRLLFHRGAR
ncbi:MAG: tetratricopeptide repeat protein [Bryobacteraceae bacterium]